MKQSRLQEAFFWANSFFIHILCCLILYCCISYSYCVKIFASHGITSKIECKRLFFKITKSQMRSSYASASCNDHSPIYYAKGMEQVRMEYDISLEMHKAESVPKNAQCTFTLLHFKLDEYMTMSYLIR